MVRKKKDGEIVPMSDIIRPYGLFGELDRMFEDMDSWFWGPRFTLGNLMANQGIRMPRVNVKDEGDKYAVTAEMPGIKKENLEISVHDNVLEINAEENLETNEKDEDGGYIFREMRRCSFHRRIPFRDEILPEDCDAELKDGILTVNLKKAQETRPKKHTISVK